MTAAARLFSILFVVCAAVSAVPAIDYDLSWHTVDNGGIGGNSYSSGGVFQLAGTIGQPDAGVMSAGAFELSGGFWPAATQTCAGDVNGDGEVDVTDLLDVIAAWGACPPDSCPSDIDQDGDVDVSDLLAVISFWGPC